MRQNLYFTPLLAALLFFLTSAVVNAGDISAQLQSTLDTAGPREEIAVIIQLNDQIDRKQFRKFKKKLRRLKLLKKLKAKAANDQASLKTYLKTTGGKKLRSLWIINGMAVKAKPSVIKKLAKRPEVKEVRLDAIVPLVSDTVSVTSTIEWNIGMVGADLLWNQGYQGQGIVIGSMDSGVDYRHNQLSGNWRGGTNSWFDPHGEHNLPYDSDGHGTQTMGIMAGQNLNGTTIGVAPLAQWIAVKVFADNGDAFVSDIHEGFQWLLDPDGNPNTDDAPDIVNNSWGFPETKDSCYTEFSPDIQMFQDLGIGMVFSAGNQGAGPSSISPANNPGVFAVGAVDEAQYITSFSSQGPSACDQNTIYPAAVAPGYLVNTADITFGGLFPNATILRTGTSFAAPHVTGVMALLLSSNPDLTPDDLETAIKNSSLDLGLTGADNVYGFGLINAADALTYLDPSSPPPVDQCSDGDNDNYFAEPSCGTPVDCDDTNPTIFPGAPEVKYDGIDQNCNGYDLTINITKALYRKAKDKLIIYATSSLGSGAELRASIPGIGTKTLRWKAKKQRWQKTIRKASAKGFPASAGTVISVSGVEGTTERNITIK